MRVERVAAAGLVGGEEDLGALERCDSYIFTNIGVIYPNCYTVWCSNTGIPNYDGARYRQCSQTWRLLWTIPVLGECLLIE